MQALCGYGEGMCPACMLLSSQGSPLKTRPSPWALCKSVLFLFPLRRKKLTWTRSTWFIGFRLGSLAPQSKYGQIHENHSILEMVSNPLILQMRALKLSRGKKLAGGPSELTTESTLNLVLLIPKPVPMSQVNSQSSGQCFLRQTRPDLLSLFDVDFWNVHFNSCPELWGPFFNALSLGSTQT